MSKIPELSIMMVGHVDHGKTTLLERLSGKWTDTHSEELKRGITIRLGYATIETKTRKLSFIDAPGHETLMATMLSGAAIADAAILLVAANEDCPQPQTKEHLMALEIIGIKKIIIVQNKIDLVSKEDALKNHKQIKDFIKGTIAEKAPIIPISAQHNINIDALQETIEKEFPTPKRDNKKDPLFLIARSFDINKPGTEIKNIQGGVLGGAMKQGILKVDEEVEIKPGLKTEKGYKPIITKITNLISGDLKVKELAPGGSSGIATSLDPSIVKADQLTGNILGKVGKLPPVWEKLILKTTLLKRIVGAKDDLVVDPIKKGEPLMLNVSSAVTIGVVTDIKKGKIQANLKIPICAEKTDRVTISRRLGTRWRLIGYAEIEE
tara:strand:- start:135 stop:1274 length:1140 start_codon:yes stop_codon:yes gene_type:complete